mmetsp:Transcript_3563/g.10048  ORF Transcript_3563/g.10048 Transcript_3563/m.10048 type:complete len:246 (-) Transcript_3563:1076-1813(-)
MHEPGPSVPNACDAKKEDVCDDEASPPAAHVQHLVSTGLLLGRGRGTVGGGPTRVREEGVRPARGLVYYEIASDSFFHRHDELQDPVQGESAAAGQPHWKRLCPIHEHGWQGKQPCPGTANGWGPTHFGLPGGEAEEHLAIQGAGGTDSSHVCRTSREPPHRILEGQGGVVPGNVCRLQVLRWERKGPNFLYLFVERFRQASRPGAAREGGRLGSTQVLCREREGLGSSSWCFASAAERVHEADK